MYKPGSEYFLRISFALAEDELWAKKGYEVASQQFELPVNIPPISQHIAEGNLSVKNNRNTVQLIGNNFKIEFDKNKGTFSKIEKNGNNILQENGGPLLHLWRAPHRKDDMWAYENWEKYGLKSIKWVTSDIKTQKISGGSYEIKATLTGTGKENFKVVHRVFYTINGNGTIKVTNDISFNDPKLILARIGVRMFLNKELEQFDYLGRGPMENYPDRKSGFDVGHYYSTVKEQMTPYEKPMESGNHEDVRWANIQSQSGLGLTVKQGDDLLQVAALPYSDEEMENVEYKIDLPQSRGTVLCISHKTLGVGSWGCGPKPLEQYMVYAKATSFNYEIDLNSK